MEHYAAAGDDKEKKDEIIREDMRYSFVLNVLAALKQEDPELYDMCLNYPSRKHKEASLAEQGWRITDGEDGDGEDGEDGDGEDDEYSGETYSPEEVDEMKSSGETPLEIHTNDTIERFNVDDDDSINDSDKEPLLRLYHDEDKDVYKPIVRLQDDDIDMDVDGDRTIIKPPSAKKQRVNLDIYQSDDIRILWGVKDALDFSKKFTSVVIECQVSFNEEQWRSSLKQVCLYMDKHKQKPSSTDKNVNLKNANLKNVKFDGADMENTNFQGAILEGAFFWNGNFKNSDFTSADMKNAIVSKANFEGANFSDADLSVIIFNNTILENANLTNANLEHCYFKNTNLKGANLKDAKFRETIYNRNTIFPDGFDPEKFGLLKAEEQ
jgi:uncharacterized protein YjbI with pentapeptide repeats